MPEQSTWLLEGLDGSAVRVSDDLLSVERPDGTVDNTIHLGRIRSSRVLTAGAHDEAFLLLGFIDPSIEIFGVRMDYTPFRLAIHPKRVDLALQLAAYVLGRYLEWRRMVICTAQPPAGLEVDVENLVDSRKAMADAIERIRGARPAPELIRLMQSVLLEGEMVAELMNVNRADGVAYMFTVTTDRILLTYANAVVEERPLAGVYGADVSTRTPTHLNIRDLAPDADFGVADADERDVVRVAAAIQRALQVQGFVGSLADGIPSTVELFNAWESVRDQHALAMITDDEASRRLFGILYTAIM